MNVMYVLTLGLYSNPCFSILVAIAVNLSPGSSCNKQTATNVPASPVTVSVMDMGAKANGSTDDTRAFQKAIDHVAFQGGGTVIVPNGKYLVDADTMIVMKSNITLKMDPSAELITKPTKTGRNYVLMIMNASNVNIVGGRITGDRNSHLDTTGEWGMGIAIYAGTNVTIDGTHISACWGDGIVIGAKSAAPYYATNASKNVVVKNVVCDNNRRQAITIGKANGVLIDSCVLTNTAGTKPMCGIDIEPDRDTAQNIVIRNSELAYNKGNGVEVYVNARSVVRNVVVKNNFIHHNTYGGYLIRAQQVDFTSNRIIDNKYSPAIRAKDTVNCTLSPNSYD